MAVVSDIEIRLRADIARLQQDMNAVRRQVDGGMSAVTKAVNLAKAALAGLSVMAFAKEVITAQREFDKLNSSLITAVGSTEKAAQAFKALQNFAATTPYSVQEATEAFIRLRNLGLSPSEAALRSYGNTASSQSKPLMQFIEAVADATVSQFERLNEFGIKTKQNGDLVSFTFKGITKTIGNNSKDIQDYLRRIGDVDFAGAMERRANTLDGAISNLSDSWQGFLRTVAGNGAGDNAASWVMGLSSSLSDLGEILGAVTGKVDKQNGKIVESAGVHEGLTFVFKGLGIAAVLLSAAFKTAGDTIAAYMVIATKLATLDFEGAKQAVKLRIQDAKDTAKWASDRIEAIIAVGDTSKKVNGQISEAVTKSTNDQLAQYEILLTPEQKREKALQDSLELRNRLNGVNAQTAGDLKKLKEALETGAISQAQYNKFVGQITKETTLASTAYKEQVKALDATTEAVKRRLEVQGLLNQREQDHIAFLLRTGQIDEETAINKTADSKVAELNNEIAAQEKLRVIAQKRIDNQKEVAGIEGNIAILRIKINNEQEKREEDLFELSQKYRRQGIENAAALIEAAQAEAKSQKDRTRDMQDEIDMLGMTSLQVANVTAARLRDQAVVLESKANVGIIEEENEALRQQAEELRKQADLGLTKQRLQEQQKFWSDLEQTAHDTFVSIADGGKGTFQRLKDSAKNMFFDWLYQMTLKKWIINIGASVDGSAATAALGNGGGGLLSMLTSGGSIGSGLSSLYSSLTGGMTAAGGVGTGFVGSLVGGLNGAGAGAPLGSALGLQIGNGIAGVVGPSIAGALSTGIGAIATALPWVAGAAAIYSIGKAAFGRGPKEYADNSTLTGMLGSNGFSGSINTAYTQKGGWFRSDKNGVDSKAVDAAVASGLSATYQSIKDATSGFAKVLGLNADSIANRTQTLNVTLGKDEAANQKAIADFFSGVSDSIATELLPSISQFQAQGETSSATLQRLSSDFQSFNALMEKVGVDVSKAFGATGTAAIQARERIIALAGGLDQLGTQTEFYYTNFISSIAKVGPLQKQVNDQLAALGVSYIKSMGDYSQRIELLVASGEASTEEGSKLYAGLLKLAPAFKTLNDAIQEINQQNVDFAMATLSKSVDKQKEVVSKAYNDAMAVLDARIDGLNGTISRTTELSQELKNAMQGIDTPQASEYSRRAAQAQITAFLAVAKAGGALPNVSDIRDAVSALGNDSSGMYSTLADYQRDVARTNNELEQLGGLTDGQLSIAEQQLAILQAQKDQSTAAYDAEISRLDSLAVKAQEQIDIIKGVYVSSRSIEDALKMVNSSISILALGMDRSGTVPNITPVKDGGSVFSGLLGRIFGNTVPTDNSTISYGTMSGSSASMQSTFDKMEKRLASIEASNQATAQAVNKFANQFENVSAGGNALLVEQAK